MSTSFQFAEHFFSNRWKGRSWKHVVVEESGITLKEIKSNLKRKLKEQEELLDFLSRSKSVASVSLQKENDKERAFVVGVVSADAIQSLKKHRPALGPPSFRLVVQKAPTEIFKPVNFVIKNTYEGLEIFDLKKCSMNVERFIPHS